MHWFWSRLCRLYIQLLAPADHEVSFGPRIQYCGWISGDDPQPSWLGYSVGKWEGDWLVVDTVGLNDQAWLDAAGHTHSEALRVTERFHRRDFGHMEVEVHLDDPKTFTKPVTIHFSEELIPDTDLIEAFCAEGEQDVAHMTAK